jgi:hypothetical protein
MHGTPITSREKVFGVVIVGIGYIFVKPRTMAT